MAPRSVVRQTGSLGEPGFEAEERELLPAETLNILIEQTSKLTQGRLVTATTSITRDLGLDSLAIMNFIMAVEDRFNISIPIYSIVDVETVADLARVIDSLRARQSAQ